MALVSTPISTLDSVLGLLNRSGKREEENTILSNNYTQNILSKTHTHIHIPQKKREQRIQRGELHREIQAANQHKERRDV